MRRRIDAARHAFLATADAAGVPHAVPIGFVVDKDTLYFAVDAKPKQTVNLKRLRNIASNPHVAVLFDHYDEDWSKLWWIRVDGIARVVEETDVAQHAVTRLVEKYPQYRSHGRPAGPVVAITMDRITGWTPRDNPGC